MNQKHLIVVFCRIAIFSVWLTLISCSSQKAETIPVELWWGGKPTQCNLDINPDSEQWQVRELAFYMSQLHSGTGDEWDVINFASESPKLHLVRFDKESCSVQIPVENARQLKSGAQLSFTLGVPFLDNHNNPVTQPWPLNVPDMFWTWRNGYKFLRVDMQSSSDAWAWHLGSVGCVSSSAVRAPEKECAQPNRAQQTMTVPEEENWTMVLHLDRLLGDITPTMQNRCVMHGDKEPACAVLFNNLNDEAMPVFTLEPIIEENI